MLCIYVVAFVRSWLRNVSCTWVFCGMGMYVHSSSDGPVLSTGGPGRHQAWPGMPGQQDAIPGQA